MHQYNQYNQPNFFWKTTSILTKWKTTLIFWQMEEDLNILEMEDELKRNTNSNSFKFSRLS